jgi:hypothetical protein
MMVQARIQTKHQVAIYKEISNEHITAWFTLQYKGLDVL